MHTVDLKILTSYIDRAARFLSLGLASIEIWLNISLKQSQIQSFSLPFLLKGIIRQITDSLFSWRAPPPALQHSSAC